MASRRRGAKSPTQAVPMAQPPAPIKSTSSPLFLFGSGALIAYLTAFLFSHFNLLPLPPAREFSQSAHPLRIVAVGDLHGDYNNALAVLRMAGIANRKGNWVGGSSVFVQTGDIVDRGPDTIKLYKLIERLSTQAAEAGGKVVPLLGNHEVMNMMEDLRYVTPEDIASFGGTVERKKAWSREGWLGQYLRTWNITAEVNGTVFLHGGIHPKWARKGIDELNSEAHHSLMTKTIPELYKTELFGADGPLWYRGYAQDDERVVCKVLDDALKLLKAERMVIGHTPQLTGKILSRCSSRVFVIDVGISKVYGGNRAALEIVGGRVEAIYDGGDREVIVGG